jgi:hypothetical protein
MAWVGVDAGWIGPDGVGGAYKNKASVIEAQSWYSLGGAQGVLKGMTLAGVAGQMSIDVAAGACLVSRRDGSNNVQDMGYLVPVTATTRVAFGAASASTRNDALVCAVVDTTDGAVGTGALAVNGYLGVVPGVSGTSTPRTDAQIAAYLGRGGYVRLADVLIASTDTQINMSNVTSPAPYNIVDTGWVNLTPTSGTGTCQYRYLRGVVGVRMSLSGMTSLANGSNGGIVAAGGIPTAYRPTVTVYQAGSGAGANSTLGLVSSDGSVSQWNNTGGAITIARYVFTYLV